MSTCLSIVVPAYNEEENLPDTLEVLRRELDAMGRPYEVIVVDDGSTDATRDAVRSRMAGWPALRLIEHGVNRGPGTGVVTGVAKAAGELVMFIPADLAIEPADIRRMVEAGAHADVIVGLRSDRSDYSAARKLVSVVNIALIQLLFGMRQRQFNYIHLYRRKIFERIRIESTSVFMGAEIVIKARDLGFVIREVEARYVPRRHGQASCGSRRVILKAVRDLAAFWLRRWFLARAGYRGTSRAPFKR